jgi:hypothetical protein
MVMTCASLRFNPFQLSIVWIILLLVMTPETDGYPRDGCVIMVPSPYDCQRNESGTQCNRNVTISIGEPCDGNGYGCAKGCCSEDGMCMREACLRPIDQQEPTGKGDIEVLLKFIICITMIISINGIGWSVYYILK